MKMELLTAIAIGMLFGSTNAAADFQIPDLEADGNYANVLGYSRVTDNPTPYHDALVCVGAQIDRGNVPIITVGNIKDYTGTKTLRTGSKVTEAGTLMVMSALQKANITQVERFDLSVAKQELGYGLKNYLSKRGSSDPYKKILAGHITGTDYMILGGITEANFNIKSNKGEIKIPIFGIGERYAVANIALDLRLVNVDSLEVVNIVSLQKQILGREFKAGFFDFLGGVFNDNFTVGLYQDKEAEPMQFATRMMLEKATLELLSPLHTADTAGCIAQSEQKFLTTHVRDEVKGTTVEAEVMRSENYNWNGDK